MNNLINGLAGTATSASMRYLLSVNLGPLAGLNRPQVAVFNALDMTISSLACVLLGMGEKNESIQLILGRPLGFIASLTITSMIFGPAGLVVPLVISVASLFFGLSVNILLMKGGNPLETII